MSVPPVDAVVAIVASSLVIIVAWGIWGSMPMSAWFGWHPVLMTLAFPCLMTWGRWSYALDASWGLDKPMRRFAHRVLMCSAAVVMLFGYLAIFMAHSTGGSKMYFGYDFKSHQWHEWKRVAHCWIGYAVIFLVAAQAMMGTKKMQVLQDEGQKIFTFHGQMGKVIISMSTLNMLLAVWFWGWGAIMKLVVVGLVLLCGAFATVWPKPENSEDKRSDDLRANDEETIAMVVGVSDS